MERPILLELERAELAARERRLAAEAEAEQLLLAARGAVTAIEAGTAEMVARAIDERRRALLDAAEREVAEIEAEIATREQSPETDTDARHRRAVALVVARVLAEPEA